MRGFFEGIGRGLTAYAERSTRMRQIGRLAAMSDAELAAMGLRRQDIARHVYRDIFFV